MNKVKCWDLVVRCFHWTTVFIVFINIAVFDEGEIHEFLGYVLAAVLAFRLLWGVIGTRTARFTDFWPTPRRLKQHFHSIGEKKAVVELGHNPLGALMILNLLGALIAVSLTGHLMLTDRFWGIEWMEEIHEFLAFYLLFFIPLHIGGIIFESLRSGVNLTKAMITGIKVIPNDSE